MGDWEIWNFFNIFFEAVQVIFQEVFI